MPLKYTCPRCGKLHRNIDKRLLGEKLQCSCGKVIRLGGKITGSGSNISTGAAQPGQPTSQEKHPPTRYPAREPASQPAQPPTREPSSNLPLDAQRQEPPGTTRPISNGSVDSPKDPLPIDLQKRASHSDSSSSGGQVAKPDPPNVPDPELEELTAIANKPPGVTQPPPSDDYESALFEILDDDSFEVLDDSFEVLEDSFEVLDESDVVEADAVNMEANPASAVSKPQAGQSSNANPTSIEKLPTAPISQIPDAQEVSKSEPEELTDIEPRFHRFGPPPPTSYPAEPEVDDRPVTVSTSMSGKPGTVAMLLTCVATLIFGAWVAYHYWFIAWTLLTAPLRSFSATLLGILFSLRILMSLFLIGGAVFVLIDMVISGQSAKRAFPAALVVLAVAAALFVVVQFLIFIQLLFSDIPGPFDTGGIVSNIFGSFFIVLLPIWIVLYTLVSRR